MASNNNNILLNPSPAVLLAHNTSHNRETEKTTKNRSKLLEDFRLVAITTSVLISLGKVAMISKKYSGRILYGRGEGGRPF